MYKLVVFDLDGTLLDTLDDLTSSVNYALEQISLPRRTREEVCSFVGNGIKKLMQRAIDGRYLDEERALSIFRNHYQEHCQDQTKPYDGVLELLGELQNKNMKTAVLSNKADVATKKLAQNYFDGLLDKAVGENEAQGIRKKPAPDALLSLMQELGVTSLETVYIGDSDVDIQTAKNAGVDCISVSWGFRDERFLQEHGATKIARTVYELKNFLGV